MEDEVNDQNMMDEGHSNSSEEYIWQSRNFSRNESLHHLVNPETDEEECYTSDEEEGPAEQEEEEEEEEEGFDEYREENKGEREDKAINDQEVTHQGAESFIGGSASDDISDRRSHHFTALHEIVGRDDTNRGSNLLDVVQRLVGGIDGSPFGRQLAEIEALISNLLKREEPFLVLETLNELSERLLMMNGITAERLIPSNRLARALVDILRDPAFKDHLELQLVTCRCLFNFLEVNQDFIHDALTNGAVEVLIAQLLEITYIDLTEQALQTLEMISRERISHNSIVSNDGLFACVQNLDFLTVHAQRKCLSIISNSCLHVYEANFQKVEAVIGRLFDIVKDGYDEAVCEHAWLALSRIVMSFKSRRDIQEVLFANESSLGLIIEVISGSCGKANKDSAVSLKIIISLLQSLHVMASISTKITEILLDLDAGKHLFYCLQSYKKGNDSKATERSSETNQSSAMVISISSVMAAPKEILLYILQLIGAIIPSTYDGSESPFVITPHDKNISKENKRLQSPIDEKHAKQLEKFMQWTWPIILKAFSASMESDIRKMALLNMFRTISYANNETLAILLHVKELTSILASLISACKVEVLQDGSVNSLENSTITQMIYSLAIINCIMKKQFSVCLHFFKKEGVFQDIQFIKNRVDALSTSSSQGCLEQSLSESEWNSKFPRASYPTTFEVDFLRIGEQIPKAVLLKKLGESFEIFQSLLEASLSSFTSLDVASGYDLQESVQHASKSKFQEARYCEIVWSRLQDLLLTDTNGITSYELIALGITDVILSLDPKHSDVFHTPLGSAFLSTILQNEAAIKRLINLFLEALLRAESFSVVSIADKNLGRSPIHASNLARQVRLRLVPHAETMDECEGSRTICVQAIATFRSIESFLLQREIILDNSRLDLAETSTGSDGFEFYMNGDHVPIDTTIFGAIFASKETSKEKRSFPNVWSQVHTVSYERRENCSPSSNKCGFLENSPAQILGADVLSILEVLRTIHGLNARSRQEGLSFQSDDVFCSWKLTVKLRKQLEEILIVASGAQPSWSLSLTPDYPFLFPLDLRVLFLRSTSFGYSRLIHYWQEVAEHDHSAPTSETDSLMSARKLQLGRISRQKVRISRTNLLSSALRVLKRFGASPGILEIEYFNEVGSGLGPTMEFYSVVSHEFQRADLQMWRDAGLPLPSKENPRYVESANGLFPKPLASAKPNSRFEKKIHELFWYLGVFLARALFDCRVADVDLNPQFFRMLSLANKDLHNFPKHTPTMEDLYEVDEPLYRSLKLLLVLASSDMTTDPFEEMEIFFVLQDNPEYELVPNGASLRVTRANAEQYVHLVLTAVLKEGVWSQIQSFAAGFSTVFPIDSLKVFYPEELRQIFGATEEDWSEETVAEAIVANHGYTKSSHSVIRLVKILSNFDKHQRRHFLQFLTGSPRLPIGGFKSLRPQFTVVKKDPESNLKSDDYLPSVMTCALYLKLPDYSLIEIMRSQLLRAISEGANSFHLS